MSVDMPKLSFQEGSAACFSELRLGAHIATHFLGVLSRSSAAIHYEARDPRTLASLTLLPTFRLTRLVFRARQMFSRK